MGDRIDSLVQGNLIWLKGKFCFYLIHPKILINWELIDINIIIIIPILKQGFKNWRKIPSITQIEISKIHNSRDYQVSAFMAL